MNRAWISAMLLACVVSGPTAPAIADDTRGGEAGIIVGAIAADDEMTGGDSSTEVIVGFRGGSVFSRHWGWYVDALYSEIGTAGSLGDARTIIGRTGFDFLFTPEWNARWFLTAGAGWMVADYESSASADFHNPIASLGFGQRIRIGENTRLRWELRGDHTLDDARLTDDLIQGHALIGISWGPGGAADRAARAAEPEPPVSDDEDNDGVRNKRDRCPATPPGATVDANGCALDTDIDGVPDGLDRCPRSRRDEAVGPDGCSADQDADGVPDSADVCADTPTRARVDEWGCPKDSDGDRVFDGIDQCPGTPPAAAVDATGCPSDDDGDGVLNGIDRCPDTPSGTAVDAVGCSPDSDGDHVVDALDRCPGTPAGTRVDDRGCPLPAPVFQPGQDTLILEGVNFGHDGVELTRASESILNRVLLSLRAQPDVRVEIGGHTDSTGDAGYNQRLSRRRAEVVRDYLVAGGIDAARLEVRGYGEARAIDDNGTEDGRARNRRVELKRLN